MALAQQVHPGQVWSDRAGKRFEILGPLDSTGRFPVRNVDTRRMTAKGPRALLEQVPPAPAPPMPNAGYGGYRAPPLGHLLPGEAIDFGRRASAPRRSPPRRSPNTPRAYEDHDRELYDERQAPLGPSEYEAMAVPSPVQPRFTPASFVQPPPIPAPAFHPPSGFPSELTAFLAGALARMNPVHAASPNLVSREVARALAAWRTRR